ncbi:MAG: extracellular solute-binding protein [Gaiellaceae bacterium]
MSLAIDPTQPIPIYFQLKTLLLEEILGGRYPPGDRLPTEHELCARYAISRTPVNRALSELAAEGVILRHRRRGTFVNPHWAQRQPGGRELRIVVPEGPWERLVREAVTPGLSVNVATVALPDLHQALSHAVAEGRGPDLAVLDSVWVAEFSSAGFLWPLEDLDEQWVRDEYEADFLEAFVSANGHSGRVLAVQAEADVAGLWYRRTTLASAGVEVPPTWNDLLGAGRALAGSDGIDHPLVMPGGSRGGETTTYCLLSLLASNGASVIEADGVALHSEATVEALAFLRQLADHSVLSEEVVAYEWDRPIRLLAQGQAAISFGGSYDGPALAEAAGLSLEDLSSHFGFAATPAGPRGVPATLAGGMVYGIFRQAAHPDLAMRLIERLVSPESLAHMSRSTAQIPPRRSAIALVESDAPFISTTARMLERAVVRPATPVYARVSAQLQAMLEAVLTRRLEPEAASERAAEMIGAITGLSLRR